MSRGNNYYALAIEGTREQFNSILSKYNYYRDVKPNRPCVDSGRYRIIRNALVIEITGWGEEISYAIETREYAEKLGCKVFFLNLPDPQNIVSDVECNDTDWKYFQKEGPNEYGVSFYGFRKEYDEPEESDETYSESYFMGQKIIAKGGKYFFYLYNADGDIDEYTAKDIENAQKRINAHSNRQGGLYNADGELYHW